MEKFEGDTSYTNEVICPYCGHVQSDSWEMRDGENDCDDCEKTFLLEVIPIVEYTTIKHEQETE